MWLRRSRPCVFNMKAYAEVVQFLESLQIMPKTMPGLKKVTRALELTDWFQRIDSRKVIVVAGTNGKGSTCAMLEALLLAAGQKVGFYSSPHLVSTTERIRKNGISIPEKDFVQIFLECENLIRTCELSHFEALTLLAGHFYFSEKWSQQHPYDYIILEVGLGGSFDATNAFPHSYSVITPLDFDHTNILGRSLFEIATNKFGIVQNENVVVHQKLNNDLIPLKNQRRLQTASTWIEVEPAVFKVDKKSAEPSYLLLSTWGEAKLSLKGERAAENAMTALTVFEKLGFNPSRFLKALNEVNWPGRMQRINFAGLKAPLYLSGDHNPQGVRSLIRILQDFSWKKLYLIVGVGLDKDADEMLSELVCLRSVELYLTETPFKGRHVDQYPKKYLELVHDKNSDPLALLKRISAFADEEDLVLVTGSLYLVGRILEFKS